jgi:hypothetical protein
MVSVDHVGINGEIPVGGPLSDVQLIFVGFAAQHTLIDDFFLVFIRDFFLRISFSDFIVAM